MTRSRGHFERSSSSSASTAAPCSSGPPTARICRPRTTGSQRDSNRFLRSSRRRSYRTSLRKILDRPPLLLVEPHRPSARGRSRPQVPREARPEVEPVVPTGRGRNRHRSTRIRHVAAGARVARGAQGSALGCRARLRERARTQAVRSRAAARLRGGHAAQGTAGARQPVLAPGARDRRGRRRDRRAERGDEDRAARGQAGGRHRFHGAVVWRDGHGQRAARRSGASGQQTEGTGCWSVSIARRCPGP